LKKAASLLFKTETHTAEEKEKGRRRGEAPLERRGFEILTRNP
jgi:hypothetical protein